MGLASTIFLKEYLCKAHSFASCNLYSHGWLAQTCGYWTHGSQYAACLCFSFCVERFADIDGLVQERRASSALAMEVRLSCTNPSIDVTPKNVSRRFSKYFTTEATGITWFQYDTFSLLHIIRYIVWHFTDYPFNYSLSIHALMKKNMGLYNAPWNPPKPHPSRPSSKMMVCDMS